jgi:pyruvate dehydrogenase E2 component (dihydrolipoamide acetyltransferase)
MAYEVIMPKQGLQMTEGTITKWLVGEGGRCEAGAPLFEMETDKLTITIDSPVSGTLLKIWRGEGETAEITEVIAAIGESGEIKKPLMSPRAKTAAKKAGINEFMLSSLAGTGENGLIVERDVLALAEKTEPKILPAKPIAMPIVTETPRTAAAAVHRISADMTEAARLCENLAKFGNIVSYTDIVIFAVCRALKKVTLIAEANIKITSASDIGGKIIAPVIKNADKMGLLKISEISKALKERAKNGELTPDEQTGAVFTVSDLGKFNSDDFTAVITPPETGALAVGRIKKTPTAENGGIYIREMVSLNFTYENRAIDGASAAEFLDYIKLLLENPLAMLAMAGSQ